MMDGEQKAIDALLSKYQELRDALTETQVQTKRAETEPEPSRSWAMVLAQAERERTVNIAVSAVFLMLGIMLVERGAELPAKGEER